MQTPVRSRLRLGRRGLACLLVASLWPALAGAQDRPQYIFGEPQGLEMTVHILGEVQKPGEYRVRDRTDLLELLSKAGGPTQFSRLSSITVRRSLALRPLADTLGGRPEPIQILRVNLERSLHPGSPPSPFILKPGDVVLVPRNGWSKWKDVSAVVRDLSVVASVYFLYVRAYRD